MRTAGPLLVLALSGCVAIDPAPPERSFTLSWKLVDARAGDPLAAPALRCDEAGVDAILVDALDQDAGARHRVIFSCATLEGVTPPLPAARYSILEAARASDGSALSQVGFAADNFDDAAADLGETIFQIAR
jgi:hypothetical protein